MGMAASPHLDFAGEVRAATKFPVFHAARIESDRILADAQGQAQAIIDAAKQHAANIKSSAREYNRRMNGPERERPLNAKYRQLVQERYPTLSQRNHP